MIRGALGKVAWVGRTASMVFGLALVLALVFGTISVAVAHTGSAGLFHLGHSNAASALSSLVGTVSGGMLQVTNNSTATTATGVGVTNKSGVSPAVRATNSGGGPALGLSVGSGKAPMTVSSGAARVANLDADKLDGKDSSGFYAAGSKVADADKLDGLDSRALRVDTSTSGQLAHTCDTPQQYNECAWIHFTVPAGKSYVVSVWSDISARVGSSNQVVSYCSAIRKTGQALQCMAPANTSFPPATTFWANAYNSAGASGETFLSEGTYTVSTAVFPEKEFEFNSNSMVITKVMLREWTGV